MDQEEIDSLLGDAGEGEESGTEGQAQPDAADVGESPAVADVGESPAQAELPSAPPEDDSVATAVAPTSEAAEAPATPEDADAPEATDSAADAGEVTQDDIEALLAAAGEAESTGGSAPVAEPDASADTSDEAVATLAEQQPDPDEPEPPPPVSEDQRAEDLKLPTFDSEELSAEAKHSIDLLHDVDLHVKIELGRTEMMVEDVLRLGEGSVVELEKLAGDPVDVFVNNRLVARGEVLVLNDTFCVRVSEIVSEGEGLAVG